MSRADMVVYAGDALASYGFPGGHPFGPDRHAAFWNEFSSRDLNKKVQVCEPAIATPEALERFHTAPYIEKVQRCSRNGAGLLDQGDTPAFPGCYEAAAAVVGSVLDAAAKIMDGRRARAFVPIAGLHHARRDTAGGFCVFNDCGVVIEALRQEFGLERIAYVDIDAHHGDGVYYPFESDPGVIIADIHEDGRYLYPGTGHTHEIGIGEAAGTKRNLPLLPGASDKEFMDAWELVEEHLVEHRPELIVLQCGADSVKGDPLTHLELSPEAHRHAARRLAVLADQTADGRVIAVGGGGYNRGNLAAAWCAVVEALLEP